MQRGMPKQRFAFVPQPVMGKSPTELRAYVDGADAITGQPFMQVVLDALATPLSDAETRQVRFDRSTPRFVDPDTEEKPASALPGKELDRQTAHHPPYRGTGRGYAEGNEPESGPSGGSHAADCRARGLGIHR